MNPAFGVVPQAQPFAHARAQRDDVLEGSPELHADHVVVGVHAEPWRVDYALGRSGRVRVARGYHGGRGPLVDYLSRQVRAGQHAYAGAQPVGQFLVQDLAHALAGVELQALGGADDDGPFGDVMADAADVLAKGAGGSGDDDQLGAAERLAGGGRCVQAFGERRAGEKAGLFAVVGKGAGLGLGAGQQPHGVALSRRYYGERSAPRACAHYAYCGHRSTASV